MIYNFDAVVSRENTHSVKWDLRKEVFGSVDLIPMWVADMDFPTPDFIIEAIKKRLDHPFLGYSFRSDSYYNSVITWQKQRHRWNIEKDWILFTPGVVPAINLAVLAYTVPGDKIIVQPPVYFPFFDAIRNNGRQMLSNPLYFDGNKYRFDFENLRKIIDSKTKMILLSNPHNPGGMVWDKNDLVRLAEICLKNNILIFSDEIHCDLIYQGKVHTPMATLSPEISDITVTAIAPSKTFNLAGLSTSSVIIPNERLRQSYQLIIEELHIGNGNVLSHVASEAAYTHGEEWLKQLLGYLEVNIRFAQKYFEDYCKPLRFIRPEATYLAWIDCRELNLNSTDLRNYFINEVKLGLNEGRSFGPGGDGFMRLNFACPRSVLKEALESIRQALEKR